MLAKLRDALAERYRLEGEIGRGGMAVVYAAHDLRHQRQVAVKVLSAEESAARGTERFLREIRVAAGLSHPHILPLYDSGEAGGQLFFVMPLVDGESLRQRLSRETRLPTGDAIRIAREIADALAFAHGAGVIHRDVKPENILLSHGHALLADFGIACAPGGTGANALTMTGTVVGTPDYMSPEQLLGEDSVGPGTDVYALGCVLFEMVTGAPPFKGSHLQAMLARRLAGPAPSAREHRPDVTPSLDRSLTRALAASPGERYATAAEFAESLEHTAGAGSAGAQPDLSLVVRPFDSVGDDPDLGFFSDGLTEEVIGDLSKLRALRVISRTSAMRLKGTPLNVRGIGREYDVRYVVTGSVRRSGQRIRVATEIADALLDSPVWAGKFDGSMDDPFEAQEQVARGVVDALRLSLSPEEQRLLAERPIADARAYECYRKAMSDIVRFSSEGLQRAEALLAEGLAIVGDNARLFAAMGTLHWQYVNSGIDVREERVAEAMRWLERAVALEPDLADAQVGLAWIVGSRGDIPAAMRHVDRALAADPNHSFALAFYAVIDWLCGRRAHLTQMITRLQSVDPWELWGVALAGCERALAGDREGRDRYFRRALEISESPLILAMHGFVQAQDGELEAARHTWSTIGGELPDDMGKALCLAGVSAAEGRTAEVRERLSAPAVLPLVERDAQWAWHVAEVYSIAEMREEAIAALELAVRQGMSNVWMLESRDATLAPLRGDPRFAALLATAREKAAALEVR
ncbi:MAG TPA: protein kinase [Gemmatimonadaceae bacterium]|nr:protein kinase [Gemmatimonadaceae bacterium]